MDREEQKTTWTNVEARTSRVLVTLLFTDVVGSTERVAELGDRRWARLLDTYRSNVRGLIASFGGREVDSVGDGSLAAFDSATDGIGCGWAIRASARPLGLDVRAGLHTGECERTGEALRGIAVHAGARVARLARPGELLVSRTVRDVVAGSGVRFEDRGLHELRGVPGPWRLFAVDGGDLLSEDGSLDLDTASSRVTIASLG